ncbi:hypothetical protein CDD81_8146 [Ophiocordyceps australis]|uniref:Uncharacterized protein n=1 Tax=Ophiocordyceps australis TaxID=1399860 RepID=A0A2C5XWC3_9HYPO|nr:hypothetical protein CDD81_8146 [Ophiocordyceps australis]
MATDAIYDRWLRDAQGWAPESDWDPKEYYEWFLRLRDARGRLKETYVQVDQELIEQTKKICEEHDPREKGKTAPMDFENTAKLLVRYMVAYNFYHRSGFEDLDEKMVISATQKHLGKIGMGMKDVDVAYMLQKAADKTYFVLFLQVPFGEAVKARFTEFVKVGESFVPVALDWRFKVNTYDAVAAAIVTEIVSEKKDGALPKATEIPAILKRIHKRSPSSFQEWAVEATTKMLATDERVGQFVGFRSDPGLPNLGDNLQRQMQCLKLVLESGKVDDLLNTAVNLEEEHLSWEKTIGPAVTAIRRLGGRSAGQSAEQLADYARNHDRKR